MYFIRKISFLILTVLIGTAIISCKNKNSNHFAVNIPEDKKVSITIHRYEKVLMNINTNNLKNELLKYKSEYKIFLDGNLDDSLKILQLYNFISDPNLHEIYDELIKVYPDVSGLEKKLSDAFTHLKYYFPEKQTPKVYSYISFLDFDNRIIYLDTVMAIALDMYLGKDYKLYPSVKIPLYVTLRLDSNYITTDCMKNIAAKMFPLDLNSKTLLENMIYQGKILYFTDAMLPDVAAGIKIGYTAAQMDWCTKNEGNMWAFFIQNKLLYVNDYYKIRSFISEAPSTKGFINSPPRIAEWIGWQIVKSYMENHKNMTIKDLMNEIDAQKILNDSKYKPKKN
ncbi:MAG: hypothetical protein NTZ33_08450 [Bacteroidetes bacterium]|nr:hypothetical protein [Bacteroidota bacterium]